MRAFGALVRRANPSPKPAITPTRIAMDRSITDFRAPAKQLVERGLRSARPEYGEVVRLPNPKPRSAMEKTTIATAKWTKVSQHALVQGLVEKGQLLVKRVFLSDATASHHSPKFATA